MITSTIPREYSRLTSKLSLERTDPELYNSVKNSGLSRKTWTYTCNVTGCKRYRKVLPIDIDNVQDMEKYKSATETGPIMYYRKVYYAAIQDELENGETIRCQREANKGKKKRIIAEHLFFGMPILKGIEDAKYRTAGYDGSDFRYVPAAYRYIKGKKLPKRYLACMAPLYMQGDLKFYGNDVEDIEQQLKDFSAVDDIGFEIFF